MTNSTDIKRALFAEREASFFRLRGGYPIPIAGAIWWAALGTAGYLLHSRNLWIFLAFATSGVVFPLAVLLARLFRNNFMRDRTPVTDLLFPAFGSMMLFWPIAISAWWSYPELVPLILAVGMSILWPVVGWTYGRTAIYSVHAAVRAIVCFVLWNWFPSTRFTFLPLAVSAIYLATVFAILITSSEGRQVRTQADAAIG
jgi:hypothetical protein